jgi:hypothetical protein
MSETNERAYYVAAGRSLDAISRWKAATEDKLREWKKFERKHRGKLLFVQNWDGSKTPVSMDFGKQDIPEGWRIGKDTEYARPALKTTIGRKLGKEMSAMSTPPLEKAVGKMQFFGVRVRSPGIHRIGDKWIITHHPQAEPPLDAKKLKTSQYFAMKEREEATGKKKRGAK